MEILLYFTGLALGISAFFYILSALRSTKEKISGKPKSLKQAPEEKIEPGKIAFRKRPALPPGTRICPMCGSSLSNYEGLYAFKSDISSRSKIMIMGCKYCYKNDEESGKDKARG